MEKQMAKNDIANQLDLFLYRVAHDLRGPVASIIGICNVLKLENPAGKEEMAQQYVDMLNTCSQKLDHLVSNISELAFNRRQGINPTLIDLKELTCKIFESQKANNIQFSIETSTDTILYSDAYRVEIILTQLIRNAIKFSDCRKADQIIRIKLSYAQGETMIKIDDNGFGIAADQLPRVFDLFYRASHFSRGSGLGLFLVKESLEKIGGDIDINSSLGKGTSIVVTLPDLYNQSGITNRER
jgi:signal transduction histidine kinase